MSPLARVSVILGLPVALGCASVEPPLPIPDGGMSVQVGGQSGAPTTGAGGTPDGAGGMPDGAGGTTSGTGGVIVGPGGAASGGAVTAMGGGAGTGAAGSSGNGNVGTCYPMGCPGCIFAANSLFGTPCCTSAGKCGCQAAFTMTCM